MSNIHRVGGETFVALRLLSPSRLKRYQRTAIKRSINTAWWIFIPIFLETKVNKYI